MNVQTTPVLTAKEEARKLLEVHPLPNVEAITFESDDGAWAASINYVDGTSDNSVSFSEAIANLAAFGEQPGEKTGRLRGIIGELIGKFKAIADYNCGMYHDSEMCSCESGMRIIADDDDLIRRAEQARDTKP